MQARPVMAAAVIATVVWASVAAATPRDDLVDANKAFREGQYKVAGEKYNALLYPNVQLADANDLVEAYVNLGVCRLEAGDDEGAKREFEKALQNDPNKQLDPLVITNKKAIALFDDTKVDIRTRGERDAAKRREAEEKERLRQLRANLIGVQTNTYALTFLPFGVGQFQNGDTKKGIAFLGGEFVTVSTSFAIFGYLVNKYGIRSDKVPLEEGPRVRRLQQLEIGTGIAFFGLYVWGVIDANLHYQHQVRVQLDESVLPEDLREPAAPSKKKPPKTSFHIVPILAPNSAGIGIGWEQ